MFVFKSGTALREVEAGSALIDVLQSIGKVIDGDDTIDAQRAWSYLKQLLLLLKGQTGLNSPALFDLIDSLTENPDQALVDAIKKELLIKAANRLVRLQGDQHWLVSGDGGDVKFLSLDDVDKNTPVGLDWKEGEQVDVPAGELVFALSGEAKTALTLEVMDSARAGDAFGFDLSNITNSRLAAFSLTGSLGVSGQGGGDNPLGLDVSAGLQASGSLHYLYQEGADVLTIYMLVHAMQKVGNPFDLDAAAGVLAPPSMPGLRQIRFEGASSGWLDLSLNIARAVSLPTLVKTPTGSDTLPFNENLDSTVKVGYRFDGGRELIVERGVGNTIVLTATHKTKSTRSGQLSLAAGMELTGLGEVAKQWTQYLLPDVGPELIPVLQKYATPGDLIASRIRTTLSQQDQWAQRLGALLLGDASAADVAAEIKTRIKDELDTRVAVFDFLPASADDAAARAHQLAGQLADRLAAENQVFGLFAQDLSSWIEKAIETPLTTFASDFRSDVSDASTRLADKGADEASEALQPLAEFGIKVSDAVADLNTLGEKITGPIIHFLKRYGERRDKLIAAVATSAKAKIALSIQLQNKREDALERNWISRLRIPAGGYNDAAKKDYRRWLAGRLPIASDFGGTRTGQPEGNIAASIAGTRTANISLELGPLLFNYDSIIKADADFQVGLDGTIVVGEAGFSGSESQGKQRSANAYFSGQLPLVTGAAVTAEPFVLGYVYTNRRRKALKRASEIEHLLETVAIYEPQGVFGVLRGRSSEGLSDAVEELGDNPTRVKLTSAVSGSDFDRLVRGGLKEERLGELMWKAYASRNSRDMDTLYRALSSGPGQEGAVAIKVANFKPVLKGLAWRRAFVGALGFPSREATKELASQARKMHDALRGIRKFFDECQTLLTWREGLQAPSGASANQLEDWAKQVTGKAYGMASAAADGLRFAVDASASLEVNDEIPPDLITLMAYLDELLSDNEVVAALNLESGQPNDQWQLIRTAD